MYNTLVAAASGVQGNYQPRNATSEAEFVNIRDMVIAGKFDAQVLTTKAPKAQSVLMNLFIWLTCAYFFFFFCDVV